MTDHSVGTPVYILPLDSPLADLASAGGKGANLSLLARSGFPVPGGFMVTTAAYRQFVTLNQLDAHINVQVSNLVDASPEVLEQASETIRSQFRTGRIPAELAAELCAAYNRLEGRPVAVRSSATAEDLPEMSFAGQQDTYLNVQGEEALLKAVVDCWGSLWTARAIGYRSRNQVAHGEVSLAVVVQEMVPSRAAGVLFTANPLNGLRTETVIDAALGLGEALVSGQVEPDHYVVDARAGQITARMLGAKALAIQPRLGGGTQIELQDKRAVQALPDEQILELAQLGQQVGDLYGSPQDIEWAEAGGKLYLLQSRPVTSLFPLPAGLAPDPLKVMFSFGAIQGLLDPITPLGRHALETIFATAAGLFGIRINARTQTVLYTAGERLWVNMTSPLTNTVGRKVIQAAIGMLEPTIGLALKQIWEDPRLKPQKAGIGAHGRARLARFIVPLAGNVILNLLSPKARRASIVGGGEQVLEELKARCAVVQGDRYQKLSQRADLFTVAHGRLPHVFIRFVSCVVAAMASWNLLNILTGKIPAEKFSRLGKSRMDFVLEVTRGMPFNPTTEMDLALWEMARQIRRDGPAWQAAMGQPEELAAQYLAGRLPERLQALVVGFLDKYGGRGLGEIDMGRVRWAENPTHVFEMLGSFLQIEDASLAPDVVFAKGAKVAAVAVDVLADAACQASHGWVRSRLVRFFAGRTRDLMGARESPKFFAVRLMWLAQRELHRSGQDFVESGELGEAEDLYFLSLDEIKAFALREQGDWLRLIALRREAYNRELRRRQIPRLLLSDGRAFYEGLRSEEDESGAMVGSPVSPGSAEGLVRVVLDPRKAHLQPGEILVCPGTDPSWTPLFLSAAGLVMEVGGLMTHGAVVAREYGIPAIVGVDNATARLKTGQYIRIDGSSGKILLLDEPTQT